MTKMHELNELGQSIWLDYIRRSFLEDGGLKALVDQGLRGVTSNPAIFEKAIGHSDDYDSELESLVADGKSVDEVYDTLSIADIKHAADILRPVYDESDGVDGYVSLEVSPTLANKTDETIAEARRLYAEVDRPNVMIKVPATPAGMPAIETLIADGININVTLIFALSQYEDVMEAYLAGLEKLAASGGDLSKIASVASFFVSRVDAKVDAELEKTGSTDLKGKIAIANAKAAYARFQERFDNDRWSALVDKGARVQRPLWASTSTKDPSYPDILYIDTLIGPHTVNTVPPNTLDALLDHTEVAVTIDKDMDAVTDQLAQLKELGIDLDSVTDELLEEGVVKFADAFEALMGSISQKRSTILNGDDTLELKLGDYDELADAAFKDLKARDIMNRVWGKDHTVWKPDPTEISNRLGWLHIAESMQDNIDRMEALADILKKDGYTNVLLLGMGGSSLAPEVFRKTFGVKDGYLELDVLDSTDPGAVLAYADKIDLTKTAFIVATKSGGTAETLSFFKFFYNRARNAFGEEGAGKHFIAITDPGSKLEDLADRLKFRATFLNDPNIGGRYSALSYFGLVPAALLGVDLKKLLNRVTVMMANCAAQNSPAEGDNDGGRLGAIMGELAKQGRDKITFFTSPEIAAFGDWVEQLIAESTGKEGKGILPVVGEPVTAPAVYGEDRLFVYLKLAGDTSHDEAVQVLADAGHPVVIIHLKDLYDLGGQYFLWEMATAVAGQRLDINPFDQPNVESAKVRAREMITAYEKEGKLPEIEASLNGDGITVYGDVSASTPAEALKAFLSNAKNGAYIALQAYVQPTAEAEASLQDLRLKLLKATHKATTLGFGPRFLHSTGQLHKGDGGHGLFIQFMADMPRDADIPDEAGSDSSVMSFGTLKTAQALGDRQALLDNQRQVIRFDLGSDLPAAIARLSEALN